ncbi:MAG: glycosyltransferase [Candidatus Omnitrophica bacterium]|nr:glycosyltransferase [Candidatus Omnitrophota bacterium]MDE2214711.1 glycosyltransferase [Candidatus Omnitrophota bacterium]
MKISGFTIVRNAVKFNYPALASIRSILPICDEFIVNVGDSEDATLELIRSINSSKVRIIENRWDMGKGSQVLSEQTNLALKECSGDWAFYLQGDEVIHEADLYKLKLRMYHCLERKDVDALRFKWFHFYGSFWRYRIDSGWYQKQDRIIRNNGQIVSCGDAFNFGRCDGAPLRAHPSGCFLYHYGWVNSKEDMHKRCANAAAIGFADAGKNSSMTQGYGNLGRFPAYFGTHPAVMKEIVEGHRLSREDFAAIRRSSWWNPFFWMRLRHKTGRRVKERII